jgi:acyl dehydratase
MTATIIHRVTARNTARSSPNKIHDTDTARAYGFEGGLVPGVTIFAWMCGPPIEAFGAEWLDRGAISARFAKPVYEGDDVTISATETDDGLALELKARDVVVASGSASTAAGNDFPALERRPLPAAPPPASSETLAPGLTLGTIDATYETDRVNEYLRSIGAEHSIPAEARVAHPGWLLLLANLALSNNVGLGPWIHVSSDVRLHSKVADGETVSALSRVADAYERKGHRFVELDVVIVAGDVRPAASVRHTAIYEPRRA